LAGFSVSARCEIWKEHHISEQLAAGGEYVNRGRVLGDLVASRRFEGRVAILVRDHEGRFSVADLSAEQAEALYRARKLEVRRVGGTVEVRAAEPEQTREQEGEQDRDAGRKRGRGDDDQGWER
jgi:hypothetical protein